MKDEDMMTTSHKGQPCPVPGGPVTCQEADGCDGCEINKWKDCPYEPIPCKKECDPGCMIWRSNH
jgi:hypothetical protein